VLIAGTAFERRREMFDDGRAAEHNLPALFACHPLTEAIENISCSQRMTPPVFALAETTGCLTGRSRSLPGTPR